MQHADVIVVGGGPAGSACAAQLVEAGLDVLVLDRSRFPRDKACAAWVTPEVVRAVALDLRGYAQQNMLQPVRRFRVGWIGGAARDVDHGSVVSYGVLRPEFDAWLLRHSGARTRVESVSELRRARGRWVVNGRYAAPFVVGAGGHFCPVARELKGARPWRSVVVAHEIEVRLSAEQAVSCGVAVDRPELHFTSDLAGYGWCLRCGPCLRIGLGSRNPARLPGDFQWSLEWLTRGGRVPLDLSAPVRTRAYRLREGTPPRAASDGVLLAGDAAGLAHASSGEGILPAILSGQVAAEVLLASTSGAGAEVFESYPQQLAVRLGPRSEWTVPGPLRTLAGRALLGSPWLGRQLAFDRAPAQRPASTLVAG